MPFTAVCFYYKTYLGVYISDLIQLIFLKKHNTNFLESFHACVTVSV